MIKILDRKYFWRNQEKADIWKKSTKIGSYDILKCELK